MENMFEDIEANSFFERLFLLSPEERMHIIDRMEPKDRCKYAASSHFCWEEARKSREFIYELGFYAWSQRALTIEVGFNKYDETDKTREGFKLRFEKRSGSTNMIYSTRDNKELYKTDLDNSINLIQFTANHFKKQLQLFQNTIKKLVLRGELFEAELHNYDFGLTSMTNLEVLEICDGIDFRQFFPMIRRPLKELIYLGHINSSIVTNCQQIYQVQNRFGVSHITFNNEQFCQLSASHIQMPIGKMTEVDVSNFITSWQNGGVRENFQFCYWDLLYSNFSFPKLLRLLRLEASWSGDEDFNIVQNTGSGKIAILSYNSDEMEDGDSVSFKVKNGNRNQQ